MSALVCLLDRLDAARELGLFRALDVELARYAAAHAPSAPGSFVLAVALLSRLEGLGHVCMDLGELAREPMAVLAWPTDRAELLNPEWAALASTGGSAVAAWQAAAAVLGDASSGDPQTPFILDGQRLYLRRYWALERRIAAQARMRAARPGQAEPVGAGSEASVWLDKLFERDQGTSAGSPPGAAGGMPVDWQRVACERALQAGLTLITGGPGTGKTYTAARLLVLLHALHRGPRPLRLGLAAPTGKAAARLRGAIESGLMQLRSVADVGPLLEQMGALAPARTLHALLGVRPGSRRFQHDASHPLALDVLLVDEASMVHLELFDALLQALPAQARLILLGDSEQLASVEAGSVLGDLCGTPPESAVGQQTVRLRESRRFSGAIGEAAAAVNRGDAQALHDLLTAPPDESVRRLRLGAAGRTRWGTETAGAAELGRWSLTEPTTPASAPSHAGWLTHLRLRPRLPDSFDAWALDLIRRFESFRVLCALRDGPRGVAGINEAIERAATARGWLQRRGPWYEGRPVMVTRNDPAQGLFNGDTGLVLRAPGAAGAGDSGLRAWFAQGEGLRSVAVTRLPDVDTAFAMTVHKSQGSEFDHVLLVLPDEDLPLLTRELLYTGITRARRWLTLACHSDAVLARAVERRTRRMSGLRL